jgi:hypothetical protein
MALKPDRIESHTDISFFMDTVSERGGIVVHTTSGSGVSMDDASAVVEYPADQSGTAPAGLLLNDVVDYDLSRQQVNFHRDETQVGGKVTLLRQGQVTTNMVASGATPEAGDDVYYGAQGLLTTTSTNSVKVGRFLSALDSDGYVKVDINIT